MFATLICCCPSEGGYIPNDLKCAVFLQPTLHQIPKVTKKIQIHNAPQPSKGSSKHTKGEREREKGDVHTHTKEFGAAKLTFAFNATDCLMAAAVLTATSVSRIKMERWMKTP